MEPSIATVIRQAISSRLAEVHTMIPAVVISYNSEKQTISARPIVKQRVRSTSEVTGYVYEELPIIHNVPVSFPQGGGTFIRWRLREGEKVALIFSEVDTSQFRNTDELSEPGDDTRHGLSYPVAHPGYLGNQEPSGDLPDDGDLIIEAENEIKLGNSADEFIARADRTDADIGKILSLLQTGPNWVPVPMDGGLALQTAADSIVLSGSACDKVKGK